MTRGRPSFAHASPSRSTRAARAGWSLVTPSPVRPCSRASYTGLASMWLPGSASVPRYPACRVLIHGPADPTPGGPHHRDRLHAIRISRGHRLLLQRVAAARAAGAYLGDVPAVLPRLESEGRPIRADLGRLIGSAAAGDPPSPGSRVGAGPGVTDLSMQRLADPCTNDSGPHSHCEGHCPVVAGGGPAGPPLFLLVLPCSRRSQPRA